MIKAGVYTDLSSEDYHSDKESISRSALMDFDKSPYNYWANHINPNRVEKEMTPAMVLGSAFHTFILEHNKFDSRFIVKPEPVFLKDVGRECYEQYKEQLAKCENGSKIVLNKEQLKTILAMEIALSKNCQALELIEDSIKESSYFWQDNSTELMLKCRPDILHDKMIVDLKTCSDASPRAFQSAMISGGYHVQMAMIRDGIQNLEMRKIDTCIFLAIETRYPYNIAIYILDDLALQIGHEKYRALINDFAHCKQKNEWPGLGISYLSLPRWAF